MYIEHFKLRALPFENSPDPKFFFNAGGHARTLSRITAALRAGRGLMLIAGPIGSGKTTLSQKLMANLSDRRTRLIWMAAPPADSRDLFLFIAQRLGLTPPVSKKVFILRDIMNALLRRRRVDSVRYLLMIDESHLMTDGVLDGIRLLNNLEIGSVKLIQVLLLGQGELLDNISRPEMMPFKQRIACLEVLGRMDATQTYRYIVHRLRVAGGSPSIFSDTGLKAVVLGSRGTPRVINTMCDRALAAACEKGQKIVDAQDVYHAAQGMGLGKEVFHYLLQINRRTENDRSPSGAERPAARPVPDTADGDPAATRRPLSADSAGRGSDAAGQHPEEAPAALSRSTWFLLSAVLALILSICFYILKKI